MLPSSARLFAIVACAMSLLACASGQIPAGSNTTTAGTCLEVTLTGTQGGPPAVNGLAGSGTLVRYGSIGDGCSETLLQFDAGRGTTERLSQLGLSPNRLDAIFLTHLHSDHTEGLAGLLQYRWHFLGKPVDIVCSADVEASKPPPRRTMSCRKLVVHTADAMIESGEVAQRYAENGKRNAAGPAALGRLRPVALPLPTVPGTVVWQSGEVTVSAIGTTHIAGSLAYRVDTPAGSVVIGGDAGNRKRTTPRQTSTSQAVEALAQGADILVHSAIHPAFAPGAGSKFPPPVYLRQSDTTDLGALAVRAGVGQLVLTHLIPALNTPSHGPYQIPGGPLGAADFATAARAGGFGGQVHVGNDLLTVRLAAEE